MKTEGDRLVVFNTANRGPYEAEFIAEYRQAALRWARYASLCGSILFLAFMFIAWALEPVSASSQIMRGLLATLCLIFYVVLSRGWIITRSNYVLLAGAGAFCALVGTVAIPALPTGDGDVFVLRTTPAIVCGLFVLYAFLRFPTGVSAGIGAVSSCAAMLWAPLVSGGSEGVRTFVYLAFTNIIGVAISSLIESRERELFFQRREADAAWKEAHKKQRVAEEAEREKSQLIAAISHDLRQPIMAATAHLDVMHARLMAGQIDNALDQSGRARGAVGVLGETLDQLLAAARYEAGAEQVTIEPVSLNELIREVLEPLWHEAERLNIDLRVKTPLMPTFLMTDRRSMRRVMSNILMNALKFTERSDLGRRSVLLVARVRSGHCQLDVFDTGVGIAADRLDDIWKPFVQLENDGRDREKGLGLGLFLVRRIVEGLPSHSICVRSNLGRGSRFTATIPLAQVPASVVDLSAAACSVFCDRSRFDLSGSRVLVLEDDRSAAVALVDLLESFGAAVDLGASPQQLSADCFSDVGFVDAIVCDYRLTDGLTAPEALADLRLELGYSPQAVVVTAEPDLAVIRARCGPDIGVIQKPFPVDALLKHVMAAVVASRRRRQIRMSTQ